MSKLSRKDLEDLVQAHIIDGNTADKIAAYYELQKPANSGRLATVLGILGALLAGLGVILVIAHNWDSLSKSLKTFLSFLPLVLGQSLCAYSLFRKRDSVAWREISSVTVFFGVGACISLISQLYNIDGKISEFLLTWMILTLPLVYLMHSSVTALLVIAGITWYAFEIGYGYRSSEVPIAYVIFMALLVPHYYSQKKSANFHHILNWTGAVSILLVLGTFEGRWYVDQRWMCFSYISLLCLYYLVGKSPAFKGKPFWTNPFVFIGAIGIFVILFMASFEFLWGFAGKSRDTPAQSPIFYISLVFGILSLYFIFKNREIKLVKNTDPIGFSFIIFFVGLLFWDKIDNSAVFLINIWILAIAIYLINRGVEGNHLGILNLGLLVIMILALCRFFDDRIPFVWRGIFFLATGISFFAANYILMKKRKKLQA